MDAQAQVIDFLKLNGLPLSSCGSTPPSTPWTIAPPSACPPRTVKPLFCNRAATQFYLFLLGADKPFVTREISHALGVSRLSFGKDEPLFAMLHTHPGAVSPMGLIFPEAAPVRLLCDRSLTALPAIAFHPLTPAASLWMPADAFFRRFLPLTGHEVTFLDV